MPFDRPPKVADLEGFEQLSGAQQDLLRASLEQEHVAASDVDCQLAVFYLEQGGKMRGGSGRAEELRAFQEIGYQTLTNPTLEALQARIEETGFPCVVVPSAGPDAGQAWSTHVFVAFRTREGRVVGWEKRGFDGGYEVRPLDQIFESSLPGRDTHWRTRRLASSS